LPLGCLDFFGGGIALGIVGHDHEDYVPTCGGVR
jgi:hypothetical protein